MYVLMSNPGQGRVLNGVPSLPACPAYSTARAHYTTSEGESKKKQIASITCITLSVYVVDLALCGGVVLSDRSVWHEVLQSTLPCRAAMASAGGGNDRRPYLRFRIPQPSRQGQQQITITFQPRAPGQGKYIPRVMLAFMMSVCVTGGQQPRIRVIPVQQPRGAAPSEAELREQEETTRRVAEDNHRKAELRKALTITEPPLVDIYMFPI